MPRTVSHQPLIAEARVRSEATPRQICGGYTGTGTGFSPSTSVLSRQHHSTNDPHSSTCYYKKDKRAKHGNVKTPMLYQKSGRIEHKRTFT
jgi:hypothetical protein